MNAEKQLVSSGLLSEIRNSVFLRKAENWVFAFMFFALPFFAYKVLVTITASLAVKNTAVALVQDLLKCQRMARDDQAPVRLSSRAGKSARTFSYIVEENGQTKEELALPQGVSIIGSVTFKAGGTPRAPASFIISNGARSSHIEIDSQGIITVP